MKRLGLLLFAFCMVALSIYLNHQNNQLRAENEQLRNERDYAQLAAEQLWGTINRAASEP